MSNREFRTGCLRHSEWKGFWKAHANDSEMSGEEWDEARDSLTKWLSQRYLVEYTIGLENHCWVEGDYGDPPERTLTIMIGVAEVLTVSFLKFMQTWLSDKARAWRVAVPITDTGEDTILIYPEAIRINAEAEADLRRFVETARPVLHHTIHYGRWGNKFFGLKEKAHPPLPPEAYD